MESQPSESPSTSFERITRFMSMLYTTLRRFAATAPDKKADHLPHRVEAETARHHRIVLEMAAEKPEIRLHIEFGADQAFAVFAAGLRNIRDAVEHQHRRQRQLRI